MPSEGGAPRDAGQSNELHIGLVAGGDRRQLHALEQLPIDSLWIGGHITSRNPSPEVVASLARLAALTERVAVGASVLVRPLYPPALVAKQIADIDRASAGRVLLGVGVGGEYPQEFRAMEVPMDERGSRTDEAIPLLRRFWAAEPVTHRGRHYSFDDVMIHPPPKQEGGPPILVAGRTAPAMRRAARLGDGWLPYLYSPHRYAESVARITAEADAVGRDLTDFRWGVWIFVNVDPDGAAARSAVATTIGGTWKQDVDAYVDHIAVAGTVDEVTERLRQFVDVGARQFVFLPATAGADPTPVIDRLLNEIVPTL